MNIKLYIQSAAPFSSGFYIVLSAVIQALFYMFFFFFGDLVLLQRWNICK